jgi:glutamine amidotransferase
MITVVDYGAGNLRSVENALDYLHVPYRITSSAADVAGASAVILPGVGHFGQMMRSLERLRIVSALRDSIARGVPYLGICLGMQALFESSEEAPSLAGLSIFPGSIRRFPQHLKVPHMGWNQLNLAPGKTMFNGIHVQPFVYFAHSYYLPSESDSSNEGRPITAATSDYGFAFVAAVEKKNIRGVQFHPEKSGEFGMATLRNFAEAVTRSNGTAGIEKLSSTRDG